MPRSASFLKVRALAGMASWLPLTLDASENGDLLFALPSAGFLSGILPARWFPWIAPAQLIGAATTFALIHRREFSRGWLFYTLFSLTMVLNLALWLRSRTPPDSSPKHTAVRNPEAG